MVFGLLLGVFGVWGVLNSAGYSGPAEIKVVIPAGLTAAVFAAWILAIAAARIIVFESALRQPLRGGMTMDNRRSRIFRTAKTALSAVLSTVFCTAVIYTVLQILVPIFFVKKYSNEYSYLVQEYLSNGDTYKESRSLNGELLEKVSEIQGVSDYDSVVFVGYTLIDGEDDDLEDSQLYNDLAASGELETKWMSSHEGVPAAAAYTVEDMILTAVHERDVSKCFDADRLGVDPDAFINGDEVVVNALLYPDGMIHQKLYTDTDDYGNLIAEEKIYSPDKIGLYKGGTVTLELRDNQNRRPGEYTAKIGAINYSGMVTAESGSARVNAATCHITSSVNFLSKVLRSISGGFVVSDSCHTGAAADGYNTVYIYTDIYADYSVADALVAKICSENGFSIYNYRETNSSYLQTHPQELIIALASGGCVALILLMVLVNLISLDTERERRKYGIMRALDMSKRRLFRKVTGNAALTGMAASLGIVALVP